MERFKERKVLFYTNKYQRQIIKLAVLPTMAFCVLITVFCMRFRIEAVDMILYGTRSVSLHLIDKWMIGIVIGLWLFFSFVFYQSFKVSHELVGPFGRINRELDDTIRGVIRRPIKVRDDDELAKELLQRVNILIDNLPMPQKPLTIR